MLGVAFMKKRFAEVGVEEIRRERLLALHTGGRIDRVQNETFIAGGARRELTVGTRDLYFAHTGADCALAFVFFVVVVHSAMQYFIECTSQFKIR